MRFSLAVLPALLAPSTALSIFNGNADAQNAITADDDLKIPGESPLEYCKGGKTEDYISIHSVDLVPNPPAAGQELIIKANATVKKTIEEGAYINLVVKYGLIKLLTTTADLCEKMGEVDLKCPVEPGDRVITKTVELPNQIPPGTYTVNADVYAANDEKITCLTATVKFNFPGMDFLGGEL